MTISQRWLEDLGLFQPISNKKKKESKAKHPSTYVKGSEGCGIGYPQF